MHGDDERVLKLGRDLRFLDQRLRQRILVRKAPRQHLRGHIPVEPAVVNAVHLGHPAAPHLAGIVVPREHGPIRRRGRIGLMFFYVGAAHRRFGGGGWGGHGLVVGVGGVAGAIDFRVNLPAPGS